jgi:glycine cleavage system transcriptional repressor
MKKKRSPKPDSTGRLNAVLSAIGVDRPGIVDRVSALIHKAGGNIEESRMAILGGDFAMILLFTGSSETVEKARKAMTRTATRLRLTASLKVTRPRTETGRFLVHRLRVTGLDHPGIMHRVSSVLADRDVNVASLETHLGEAPMSGAPVFVMTADLQAPLELSASEIRRALDRVCTQEALDFTLEVVS